MIFKAGDLVYSKIYDDIGFLEDNDVDTDYVLYLKELSYTIDGKYKIDSNESALIKIKETYLHKRVMSERI